VNVAELVDQLDLDLRSTATPGDLIAALQLRRALQAESLAAPLPANWHIPPPKVAALRNSQRQEIQLCESALRQLGAPLTAPDPHEEA
jgi:hypothetical protein